MSDTFRRKPRMLRGPALALVLALCMTLAPTAALADECASGDGESAISVTPESTTNELPLDEVVSGSETELSAASQADGTLVATTTHDMIDKKGYLALSVTREEAEAAFDYGDLLTVSLNGQTIEAPFVADRTFVDQLQPAIVVRQKSDGGYVVELGADNDKFASTFGLAEKGDAGWAFCAGVPEPLTVTISLAKKGGYHDRYVVKQLRYTDKRSDYPQLSDEQFANFREVTTTGIAPGILYRSATPVNPQRGRNTYSDACIKKAGVTYAVNLSDAEEKLAKYRGYDQSYYATIDHIALHASIHLDSDEYRSDLMRGFRAMAEKPGVYLIHCLEGKDRTGIAVALLEFLMGASYDEVIADHMVSFYNYFGITEADPRYESVVHGNLTAFLEKYFGVDTLKGRTDLQQKAEQYMLAGGLTPSEIAALKHNLNPAADTQAEPDQKDGGATANDTSKGATGGQDGSTGQTSTGSTLDSTSQDSSTEQTTSTESPFDSTSQDGSTGQTSTGSTLDSTSQDGSTGQTSTGSTLDSTSQDGSSYGRTPFTSTEQTGSDAGTGQTPTTSDPFGSTNRGSGSYGTTATSTQDASSTSPSTNRSRTQGGDSTSDSRYGSSSSSSRRYDNDSSSARSDDDSRDYDRRARRASGSSDSESARDREIDAYKRGLPKTSDTFNPIVAVTIAAAGVGLLAFGILKARGKLTK